ncbi:DEAD/DEAH box helicase [Streptomyces sp. NBC_01340]|uniref:DEAD/DEAH box helicase n=1 Tax=unclassified Streptomyces TaxID=2593676 RepID=UPI00224EAB22|nr:MULTISPECIES: DEAD/DEAH box helicase [unclassified Streptomyces]MCX4452251.1 DEAD/DEAH box helicase [Streptomyces sp. NBC_01719]MCX4491611.1 DEAD/DEAH box helicase [Streptomyces sp. NBC_01728]MCX4593818.1 DEAD/DEAH box helicase [Streptomyces sp. NBC_01549]WSI36909.1 DEAD/DEAH box helicase [Streptomyces sp. NBC_01340]
MNRSARTGDRFSKTRKDGFAGSGGGARSRLQGGQGRPGARSGGNGRGPSAPQGEFALPETITPALPAVATFGELDLPVELLETLTSLGVNEPFPIQAATLPNSLAGRDVLGRGRTGSGKTLAFGLALLVRTAGRRAEARKPLALILVPTRELAQQVSDALTPYARLLKLRLATVVGGMSIGRQAGALRTGAEVVVATPGRLMDLVERNDCRLDRVSITVLDEADQMADMGFMPQVTELLDQVRPDGQRMLFSATLDRNIDLLVRRYLHDPVVHSVDPSAGAVTTMEHHVLQVHGADKYATATEIAARDGRVLMFLDTKHAVDQFTRHLLGSGVKAAALHSGKSQPQRTRTLAQFKTGHITTLVATNVAARGIHVDDLDLVVNVDPPSDHKDYLHRGGRTARAGESGSVVTLVLPGQRRDVIRLMSDAGIRPHVTQVRSGEAELSRITGAQAPSGVPIGGSRPVTERPERGGAPFRGLGTRPGRAGGESRRAAEARQTAEARKAARVRRGA